MSAFYVSAAHKSSGKTTISIGLARALKDLGKTVITFKKGPDYIDPLWLAQASGSPCYNLDFNTMQDVEIRNLFAIRARSERAIVIVEGNKGLYDGMALDGSDSNAAMAKLLGLPVVLVIDTQGITRGVAPLLLGYQSFDRDVKIAGVIFNKTGGDRHTAKLQAALETYTDLPLLGSVPKNPSIEIDERHLGLVPSNEAPVAEDKIDQLAAWVGGHLDLDKLAQLDWNEAPVPPTTGSDPWSIGTDLRIGVARDEAFGFYYADDLEAFAASGARLEFFSPLHDRQLPGVDGLFIGGGFPETHLSALRDNIAMRRQIAAFIDEGKPVYAECGGLMYLSRSICWRGDRAEMVGGLPVDIMMHEKPQGRGYVRLQPTREHPWAKPGDVAAEWRAHEFHYSALREPDPALRFGYRMVRGTGIDGQHDGLLFKGTLASYTHLRHTRDTPWVDRFLDYCRRSVAENAG